MFTSLFSHYFVFPSLKTYETQNVECRRTIKIFELNFGLQILQAFKYIFAASSQREKRWWVSSGSAADPYGSNRTVECTGFRFTCNPQLLVVQTFHVSVEAYYWLIGAVSKNTVGSPSNPASVELESNVTDRSDFNAISQQ